MDKGLPKHIIRLVVCVLSLCWILPAQQLYAQQQVVEKAFIRVLGSSARSLAMGESDAADISDPSINTLNPAGYALMNKHSVSYGAYQSWTSALITQEISYRAPALLNHSFAVNMQYIGFGINEINYLGEPQITRPELDRLQLTLGYSYATSPVLSFGVLSRGYTAWNEFNAVEGVNVDLGAIYAPTANISYSFMFRGIGKGLEYEIIGNGSTLISNRTLNKSIEYSTTLYFPNQTNRKYVTISAASGKEFGENGVIYRFGLEAMPLKQLAVRGGYLNTPNEQGFSFGLGLRFSSFALSYSLLPDSRVIDRAHQVELQFNF